MGDQIIFVFSKLAKFTFGSFTRADCVENLPDLIRVFSSQYLFMLNSLVS